MGFHIYNIRRLEGDQLSLRRIGPLKFGGMDGLFSKHLPSLAAVAETWSLPAQAVLALARVEGGESRAILFDLTPRAVEEVNLYELINVSGRTVSIVTDALFHFKVACCGPRARFAASDEELIVPSWRQRPDRYEQMRLEGGIKGGDWSWSEPPQSLSATVV